MTFFRTVVLAASGNLGFPPLGRGFSVRHSWLVFYLGFFALPLFVIANGFTAVVRYLFRIVQHRIEDE